MHVTMLFWRSGLMRQENLREKPRRKNYKTSTMTINLITKECKFIRFL
jgi:hypothetical protein